jgi:hypothetical protein
MSASKVIDYAALLKKLKHEFINYSPPPIDKKNPVMMRKPSTRLTVSFVYLMFVDTKDTMNLQGLHRRLKKTNSLTLNAMEKTKFLRR